MRQRKKVAVDLNGPVRDRLEAARLMLSEVTGLHIPADEFAGKEIVTQCTLFHSARFGESSRAVTPEDWKEMNRRLYETDDGFLTSPVTRGAQGALQYFMEHDYEVCIVSSIGGLLERRIHAWLRKCRVPYDNLVLTRSEPKTPYYSDCDCVDDELPHLTPVAKKGKLSLLMYPAPGTTGSDFVKNEKLPPHVQAALGWQGAMPFFKLNLAA